MKTLLLLIICFCIISEASAQELVNVYSVANDPEFSARIEAVQNTDDGGMLLSGRMRRGDTWYGHHVSRMDVNGQPTWSTWFREHGYVAGVFETADGGAVQLYTTVGGREEIIWFSSDGSLVKRMEYGLVGGSENVIDFDLESASVLPNGNLSVVLMGYRRENDYFAGRLTIDFDSGEVLETNLWEVLGMRTTLGRINPGLSDVYYVSGLANNNDDAVIGAFKSNGELLRQWRLPARGTDTS
ncbi:MAG: hypothetical protein ACI81P_000735 [Neolewinella sp.]|jgi:hypothetical protein